MKKRVGIVALFILLFLLYILGLMAFVQFVLRADTEKFIGLILTSYPALIILVRSVMQIKRYRRGEAIKGNPIYTLLGATVKGGAMLEPVSMQTREAILEHKINVNRSGAFVFNMALNAVTILSLMAIGLLDILPGSPSPYFTGIVFAYIALILVYSVKAIIIPMIRNSVANVKEIKIQAQSTEDPKIKRARKTGYYVGMIISLVVLLFLVLMIVILVLGLTGVI